MSQRLPVVAIIGSTGVGKTQLSLALAAKYNDEIVSVDSMQVCLPLNRP